MSKIPITVEVLTFNNQSTIAKTLESVGEIVVSPYPAFRIWNVPRKYMIAGEVMECSATYPNAQPRFFHRDYVEGFAKPIHERIMPRPGVASGTLKNFMLVPLAAPRGLWAKWRRYLELEEKH